MAAMKRLLALYEEDDDSYDCCRNCPIKDECEDTCYDWDDDYMSYEDFKEKWGEE